MPYPVRCFSCGKVLGAYENRVNLLLAQGKSFFDIFEILKLERYCCRRNVMSHVDLNAIAVQYSPLPREEGKI